MAADEVETTGFLDRDSEGKIERGESDGVRNQGEKSYAHRAFEMAKRKTASSCSKKVLLKRLPVINWMKGYTLNLFACDAIAGLTVGLTAIPQGIAYAVIAGLEPQYGLYSGFMGCFVYFILGSVKDITIGPTAIMALMSRKSVEAYNSDFAVLLCFLTGAITMLFGILHLGFLVSFISVPVTVGFTTAAAITIASSQVKGLLGIKGKSNEFLESWISIFERFTETRFQDLLLGLFTIFFLVLLKYSNEKISRRFKLRNHVSPSSSKALKETFRLIALSRNAIVVVIGALAAFIFEINGMKPFTLTENVLGGLPTFSPPPFSTNITDGKNETIFLPFQEMVEKMGTGIVSVPLISILETIAIAKSFAKGKALDATQEMIALGACNMAGSFVRSMPTAGSFTRTAVNNASNVKTPLGGIFTGILVLSALSLSSTFKYIPKATLAGLIMTAMFYMVEVHEIKQIWQIKKSDAIPLAVTIFGCLFMGLDVGIIIGIVVNLVFILYGAVRPKVTKKETLVSGKEIVVFRPEQAVSYPGAEYVKELVLKESLRKSKRLIVLDGRNVYSIDATVAKNLKTLTENIEKSDGEIVFWNWSEMPMTTCLKLDDGMRKYFQRSKTLQELILNGTESNGNV